LNEKRKAAYKFHLDAVSGLLSLLSSKDAFSLLLGNKAFPKAWRRFNALHLHDEWIRGRRDRPAVLGCDPLLKSAP
jgi:hypothetical protein